MESKVEVVESEISEIWSVFVVVENMVKENHMSLIGMLEKYLGKSLQLEEVSVNKGDKPLKDKHAKEEDFTLEATLNIYEASWTTWWCVGWTS